MKKLTRFSLVLMLFSLLSISYHVTSASADDNVLPGMAGGQCDPNPACVENCCAPGPNNHGGPNDHHNGPNDHGDPCMNMPPGPAQADCYRHKDDHRGPNDHHNGPNDHMRGPNDHGGPGHNSCASIPDPANRAECEKHSGPNDHRGPNDHHNGPNDHGGAPGGRDCAAIPHPNGSAHVDPPQSKIDAVEAEYKAGCKAGNCGISPNTYASLESLGHSREEIDCFLQEGERRHHDQHGGPGHNSCASIPDPAQRAECEKHSGPNDHRGPN